MWTTEFEAIEVKSTLVLSQRWKTTQAIIQYLMTHHDRIRREMLAMGEIERTESWPLPDWMQTYPTTELADFIAGDLAENVGRLCFFEDGGSPPLLSHCVEYVAGETACRMRHRLLYGGRNVLPSHSA